MSVSIWTVHLRRAVFAALICMICAVGLFAPPSRGAELPAPEEYIFRVLMPPKWTITDVIFAYQFRGAYYLPIVELAEAYEFFVEPEVDRAFVTGFAGREENAFTIDGERGEVIVKGERRELPPDAILPSELVDAGDIYVEIGVLNDIWPVEMRVDLPSITIFSEAEEELSFVRRVKREEKRTIFEARQAQKEVIEGLPYKENPYSWFGKPVLDWQSSYSYNNNNRTLTGSNNVTATQHIGKFIADYSASYSYSEGDLHRPDSIRARFSRQAAGEEDLFIPTLKRIDFGDISLGQRDLVSNNAAGRGFVVSNKPSVKTREFDRITIEGTGPPGWELELYHNNTLTEFGVIEPDGEYRFEDVVLNFGNNVLRVIMYGPQGQIREVVEEHKVGSSLLSPGELRYRGGFLDTDRALIPIEKQFADRDPDHINTKNAEFSYGLNQWLTLFGSYTAMPFEGEEAKYYTGGLGYSTPLGVGEIEGYRKINGGSAIDTRFVTKLMGIGLNLRGAFFNRFESPIAGEGDDAKTFEGEAQASTTIPLPFMPVTFRLNLLHTELDNGLVTTDVDTSQSFTGGGLRFGHGTNSRFINEIHETSTGSFDVNWSRGDWQTRGGLNYRLHPVMELSNGGGDIRYNPGTDFQAALNFQHNFPESLTTVGGQLGYDFGDILSTVDAQYRQEQGWLFTLRASASLNPYYHDSSYRLSSNSRKGMAPVRGHVFLDRDGDGVFTEGDEPLKGVRLKVDRSRSVEETDENGNVVVPARSDQNFAVTLDESSLVDPYYRPAVQGYSTTGLRGAMPSFAFPVVETGAIDGTVWEDDSGRPVGGMILELVAEDGTVAMTTETAFDGYYAFEFVSPGAYTVRADPSYQVNVPAETVTVSSEELFAFGIDLYLLEPAAEESAADQADGESGGVAQTYHAPAVSGTSQPAPASPPDEGSSLTGGETSREDGSPAAENPADGGSSPIGEGNPGGGASSAVKDVRIGEHPDKVRLVMDLSAPASYEIQEGEEGMVILIDLPNTVWEAKPGAMLDKASVMESFGTEELPDGGIRVILRARNEMIVKEHALLPANGSKGPRLYIDLQKK